MNANESESECKTIRRRRTKRVCYVDEVEPKIKILKVEKTKKVSSVVIKEEKIEKEYTEELDTSVCDSCGTTIKEQGTSVDASKTCSKCKNDEYVDKCAEKKNKVCEHCKTSVVDEQHKMIGCLICLKYYHVDCLLPGDVPQDLSFEPDQFIRRKLGCIRCAVIHLCYKVRDIVTWRWRPQAINVENPDKYFMPREFFVHYNFLSYWDCEWISELQFEMSEPRHYSSYKRRSDLSLLQTPDVLSDGHKRKMSQLDIDLHEKYVKWGVDAEWLQPQRILTMDDVGCVVKWRGLGYDYLSTEPLTRIDEIYGLQESLDAYKKLEKEMAEESNCLINKSKITKLTESPNYLGPIESTKSRPTLHPYQVEGVNWLRSSYSNDINTILADEMGLGKTIEGIAFLYSLYKDNISKGPYLVVVPLSTMKNWEREFEFWAPNLVVISYHGTRECRANIRNYFYFNSNNKKVLSFHVVLTTYELICYDDVFLSPLNWEILIIDEAHRLKNNQSKLFKSFKKYKIKYRNLMTGTPLQNNLEELFHLLNFMEPNTFGDLSIFLSQFQDVSKEEQVKTLQEMLKKHILRRMKSDVMYSLPIKEEQIVRLDLTTLQKDLYKMILTRNYEYLGGKFSSLKMGNIMMHLRKVCNHPYLNMSEVESQTCLDGSYDVQALVTASGKMELLQKMLIKLRNTGHRVLLFSGMTKLLDLIEYMLDDLHIQYERIDGNVSSTSRQNAIDRFNDPSSASMVFLLSTRAGGLGINLSSADTVIIYDSDWNPHNDIQALSRAHRIGQQKKVMIYRFVTRNSVEEKVMETAKRKMMVTNLVVKHCTKSEFHQILSFGTKELFDENASDDQKIIYDDAAIDILLDRNRTEIISSDGELLDTCFSGFKVADCQFSIEDEPEVVNQANQEKDTSDIINVDPESYWKTLLAPLIKSNIEIESIKEPELGKGLRNKRKVVFVESEKTFVDNTSETSDTVHPEITDADFEASEEDAREHESSVDYNSDDEFLGENEEKDTNISNDHSRSASKFLQDRDYKRLICYGLDKYAVGKIDLSSTNDQGLIKYNRFCVVNGFFPVERMDIYIALMNHGLPPKILRKSDLWWPSTLQHKTVDEMNKYIMTLMGNIIEYSEHPQLSSVIPRDNVDYDLLLARIGLNALIAFKVNQFEIDNKMILERLTYKQCDVKNESIDNVKTTFDEFKDIMFEFNIWDGEFSKIHSLWSEYESVGSNENHHNIIFDWSKLHDYILLSAIAFYGYDLYLDKIFLDSQFQVLLIPFKIQSLDFLKDNFQMRRFIRNRQVILENALLIEAQITKVSCVFEFNSSENFSLEKLKHYHSFFVNQGKNNFVTHGFANTKFKLKAITQLELLINDIEGDSESYKPIEIRKSET